MLEYRVVNLQEQLNMADTYFKNLDDDSKKKYVSQVLERCKQVWGLMNYMKLKMKVDEEL